MYITIAVIVVAIALVLFLRPKPKKKDVPRGSSGGHVYYPPKDDTHTIIPTNND